MRTVEDADLDFGGNVRLDHDRFAGVAHRGVVDHHLAGLVLAEEGGVHDELGLRLAVRVLTAVTPLASVLRIGGGAAGPAVGGGDVVAGDEEGGEGEKKERKGTDHEDLLP